MVSITLNLSTEVFVKMLAFSESEHTNTSRAANTLIKRGLAYTEILKEKSKDGAK